MQVRRLDVHLDLRGFTCPCFHQVTLDSVRQRERTQATPHAAIAESELHLSQSSAPSLAALIQARELVDPIGNFSRDLDGVVCCGETLIARISEALANLRSFRKHPFLHCKHSSAESHRPHRSVCISRHSQCSRARNMHRCLYECSVCMWGTGWQPQGQACSR